MTPERMARLTLRWVRFYTRNLPPRIAQRRIDEIDADLHDQIAYERARGIGDARIARAIASRMLRGLAADTAWRRREAELAAAAVISGGRVNASKARRRPAARVAVGVLSILSLPLAATQVTGEVVWSPGDFVVAGIFLAALGVSLELAVKRAGNVAVAIGIAAVGVAAAIWGKADDAPGLVILGILLVVSACAVGVRAAQHGR